MFISAMNNIKPGVITQHISWVPMERISIAKFSSVQFSPSVVSDSLQLHAKLWRSLGLQGDPTSPF